MKQRFYFDTSVFGGVFDIEFEEITLQLFETVRLGEIICLYSNLTEKELEKAPDKIKDYFKTLPIANLEKLEVTDEILTLAEKYISEKVVGQTSFDDCVHIATATINKQQFRKEIIFKQFL
jgi:predicted nucleic acid-binding protein